MRDAIVIPLNGNESLVVATDNSGSVGMKEQDDVKVAYDIVGYFSFRVAMMECLAAGAKPMTIVIQNFCGDHVWTDIVSGVRRGMKELGLEKMEITGSTESNFSLVQSVVGLNVIGVKSNEDGNRKATIERVALVGLPLVGNEVMSNPDKVAPLSLFHQLSLHEDVRVWPVGSKGVGHELERMHPGWIQSPLSENIDLHKSGGPSTSFLVGYPLEKEEEIKRFAGDYFHVL